MRFIAGESSRRDQPVASCKLALPARRTHLPPPTARACGGISSLLLGLLGGPGLRRAEAATSAQAELRSSDRPEPTSAVGQWALDTEPPSGERHSGRILSPLAGLLSLTSVFPRLAP